METDWAKTPRELAVKARDCGNDHMSIENYLVIKSDKAEVWMNIKPRERLISALHHHLSEHDRGDMPAFDTEEEEKLFIAAARALVD